jgi:hypothetical protein
MTSITIDTAQVIAAIGINRDSGLSHSSSTPANPITGNNHRAAINSIATIPTMANKIVVRFFITGTALLAISGSDKKTPGPDVAAERETASADLSK